jgi:hypothetical protein
MKGEEPIKNKFKIDNDMVIIYIKNKNSILECYIDVSDFNKINDLDVNWIAIYNKKFNTYSALGKFKTSENKKDIFMHRYLLDAKDDEYVLHKSENNLDNRRKNIYIKYTNYEYIIEENIVKLLIPRTRGKYQGIYECLIDLDDLEKVLKIPYWNIIYRKNIDNFYVAHSQYIGVKDGKVIHETILLHNYIMDAPTGFDVDHIEHKMTLDNRKSNLRIAEPSENSSNRKGANKNSGTGIRNVNYGANREEYWVQFSKLGVRYKWVFPLSQFKEACNFADIKRKEIFGEFSGNG